MNTISTMQPLDPLDIIKNLFTSNFPVKISQFVHIRSFKAFLRLSLTKRRNPAMVYNKYTNSHE